MAPDEIQFLILLYAIYLSDCFFLPRSSAVLVHSRFLGARFRVASTAAAVVLARRFWLFRPLLPPLGFSRGMEFSRIALGADGFCSMSALGVSAEGSGVVRYVRYDDVESVEVRDFTLFVNGERWFKGHGLLRSKDHIQSIVDTDDRSSKIRAVLGSDVALGSAAAEEVQRIRRRCRWLSLFCSLHALAMLLYLPAVLFRFPGMWLLWYVAAPLLWLHLVCGMLFLSAHKALAVEKKGHRWEAYFKMLLCPPMMIRAADVVADDAATHGDPVATLMSVLDEREWRPVVQRIWRGLIPRERDELPREVARAVSEHAEVYRSVFAEALTSRGIDPVSLEVDAAAIPAGQHVCPRCEAHYRSDILECGDCGGIPLLAGKKEVG